MNFTDSDHFTVQSWCPKIILEAQANWYQKHGWMSELEAVRSYLTETAQLDHDTEAWEYAAFHNQHGFFNLPHVLINKPGFYRFISLPFMAPLRAVFPLFYCLTKKTARDLPKKQYLLHLWEWVSAKVTKRSGLRVDESMRKVMKVMTPAATTKTEASMAPLRAGR